MNKLPLMNLLLTTLDHLPNHLLVERGFEIHTQITRLSEELHVIQKQLKKRASNNPHEWHPLAFDSDGTKWVALGRGCEFHIHIPTPPLKSQIETTTSRFPKIKALSTGAFSTLFRKITAIQIRHPETFRDQVSTLFPMDKASRLISLCSARREPQIIWTRYARATAR